MLPFVWSNSKLLCEIKKHISKKIKKQQVFFFFTWQKRYKRCSVWLEHLWHPQPLRSNQKHYLSTSFSLKQKRKLDWQFSCNLHFPLYFLCWGKNAEYQLMQMVNMTAKVLRVLCIQKATEIPSNICSYEAVRDSFGLPNYLQVNSCHSLWDAGWSFILGAPKQN